MGKVRRDAKGEETVWYFDREREGGSKSQTVGFMHLWVAQCLATSVAVQMNRRNNTYGPENSSCISSLCITLSVFEIRHLSWAAHGITGKPKGVLARGQFLWARAQAFIPHIYICISTHTRVYNTYLREWCSIPSWFLQAWLSPQWHHQDGSNWAEFWSLSATFEANQGNVSWSMQRSRQCYISLDIKDLCWVFSNQKHPKRACLSFSKMDGYFL